MELPEGVSFEEYLARALPEDVTTETFLDPLSLGGLPGKGTGAMGHPEVRAGLSNVCLYLEGGRGDARNFNHSQRRHIQGVLQEFVESATG